MDKVCGGEVLRIVVRSDNIAITSGRLRGTLYGDYTFLEGVVGIRCLTTNHTCYPPYFKDEKSNSSTDRGDVDYTYCPRFSYRLLYYPEGLYPVPFSRRIRSNATIQPNVLNDRETSATIGGWAPSTRTYTTSTGGLMVCTRSTMNIVP